MDASEFIKRLLEGQREFRGAELGRAELREVNLSGVTLSGADLSGANLNRANLIGANLSEANLSEASFGQAYLKEADFSRADLSRANLRDAAVSKANLRGANLTKAYLSKGNFSGANLSGANLSGANLSEANLSEADLSEADLSGANLSEANLNRAHLSGANLTKANLSGANLSGANLSGALVATSNLGYPNLGYPNLGCPNIGYPKLWDAESWDISLNDVPVIKAIEQTQHVPGHHRDQSKPFKFPALPVRYSDLSKAESWDPNLSEAPVSKANLIEADLAHANFTGTNLSGVNLSGANLTGANFSRANLSGANLGGTDLRDANLTSVSLRSVRMDGARMSRTTIADVELPSAEELMKVVHLGPSELSTGTLTRSRGRIPAEFLQGCGLADWEIEHAKLYDPDIPAGRANDLLYLIHELRFRNLIQFYSVFISHSHADEDFARRLHSALQNHGVRCWLDKKQLLPGDDIHDSIDHGIRLWDKVLLAASRESLTSWWVDAEIEKAFAKEQTLMRERRQKVLVLVPLALDDYLFSGWSSGKATQVKARMAGNFKDWKSPSFDFESAVEPLVRALRADGSGREPPPIPKL